MRGLDRYVGHSVFTAITLVLLVIVGLDAVSAFIDEIEEVSGTYTFAQIAFYILLTLPGRIYEFIPFAALIGSLVGLGQLASSSELVVMRAAGVSIGRLVWIAMKPALLVAVLGSLVGEYLAPPAEQLAQSHRAMARNPAESFGGRHRLWNREGNSFMHFNALDTGGVIYGITLLQFDEQQRMQSALRARRASYQGSHWVLDEVVRTNFARWQTVRAYHPKLRWDTGITPELLAMVVVKPDKLRIEELYRYSRYLNRQGQESADYQLTLWRKLLQPAAIGGLVLVAISFIFGPLREGTMGFRIFVGVLVGIAFRTSQDLLGPASLVFGFAPLYAALAPIVICYLAGLLLLGRAR